LLNNANQEQLLRLSIGVINSGVGNIDGEITMAYPQVNYPLQKINSSLVWLQGFQKNFLLD